MRSTSSAAADQGIDAAFLRLLVQIDAVAGQRLLALLDDILAAALFLGAVDGPAFRFARDLGDAVRNVVDRVVSGHVLLLQEEDSVALTLRKHGDQDIGARHLFAAARLNVDRCPLQDTLEARRGLRFLARLVDQIIKLIVDVVDQLRPNAVDVDAASAHHRDRVLILRQRKQKVLERRVVVAPFVGIGKCSMEALLEIR